MTKSTFAHLAFCSGIFYLVTHSIACGDGSSTNQSSGSQSTTTSSSGSAGAGGMGSGGEGGQSSSSSSSGNAGSGGNSSSSSGSGGGNAGMTILHADFEQRAAGEYTEAMVEGDFGFPAPWNNGLDEGRATIVDEAGNKILRVTYPANEFGPNKGGVQFKVPFGQTYSELYLSYRIRFANGFDFVKGGKIPGLVGGTAPTGCINDTTGFSARMMWRTGGAAVQYMYFPEKVNACGDDYPYDTGNGAIKFQPGTWHTVEHRVIMNTPGNNDGTIEAWFDGKLALSEKAFLLRLADGTYGIDTLYFSTFFGGGDSSWAPTSDQIADFDEFIVSTAPITH